MNISPINLSFETATRVGERALKWCNYNNPPKLMKLTNTGKTVMLSGKWYQNRPYIKEGPLMNAYIFSQIHFHWGSTDLDGSEHGVEGKKMAVEMHIVHFNAKYRSLEEAKNKADGTVVVVYFFQIDDKPNDSLNQLITQLPLVNIALTSVNVQPFPLDALNLELFTTNYFLYCGAVGRENKPHLILWLIYPISIAISHSQVTKFRDLKTADGDLMSSNCHEMQNIININGVFFLDRIIDRGHRKESSLPSLPSLKHIYKMSSLTMNGQNINLKSGTHSKDVTNTEFLQKDMVPMDMKSSLQELKTPTPNGGEKIATLGSTNQNEVGTAYKYQMKRNEAEHHAVNSTMTKTTHCQSRLESGENEKELNTTDCDSEISIGDAIGSTTLRLCSKVEYIATNYSQNLIHDATGAIEVEEYLHSKTSLGETRGSTLKRIDWNTERES